MDSIWGSSVLLKIYLYLLLFYEIMIYIVVPFLNNKQSSIQNRQNGEAFNVHKQTGSGAVVQAVFSIILFFVLFLFLVGPFLTHYFWLTLILSYIFFLVLLSFAISNLLRSVYFNPSSFKIMPENENIIGVVGFFLYLLCNELPQILESDFIVHCTIKYPLLSDFIYFLGIVGWYYSILFFSSVFILIFSYHICSYIFKERKPKEFQQLFNCDENKINIRSYIENFAIQWLTLHNHKLIHRIYKKLWPILVVFFITIDAFLNAFYQFIWLIINGSLYLLTSLKISIFTALLHSPERKIIFLSRSLFAFSLLIVYTIDHYQGIFSPAGSEMYEFICSVVLIPFLITELSKIRKKSSP